MSGKATETKPEKPEATHEDFIVHEPIALIQLTKEQHELAAEHRKILSALASGNMSVKEIHDLYTEPGEKRHSKTLKTIYRYMDALESAGLVAVAGHRKHVGKRGLEKLYCRTARLFTYRDEKRTGAWWGTEEGARFLENVTELFQRFYEPQTSDQEGLKKLIIKYYDAQMGVIDELLERIRDDEGFARLLVSSTLNETQKAIEFLGMIGVYLRIPEFQEELRSHVLEEAS